MFHTMKKHIETTLQRVITSPIGKLYLVASENGLRGIHWKKQSIPLLSRFNSKDPISKILQKTEKQLQEYFTGSRKKFELKLDLDGTEFQKKVWSQLMRVPYAHTRSYKDVAIQIGKKKAVRAVGSANGKNPICIIVPCHRVITSSGSLGGYSGGLKIKTTLLELEKKYTQ